MCNLSSLSRQFAVAVSAVSLLFSNLLLAAEPSVPVTEVVSISQIINLLGGLVIVLLVFFAVVFLLKRLSGLNGVGRGHMKMVDTMHIGTKERLLIIKVTDKHLLLGVSQQGIHPLHVFSEDFVEEAVPVDTDAAPIFNQLLSKMKGA